MSHHLDMGNASSRAFAGESRFTAGQEIYGQTVGIFTEQIRSRLIPERTYTLADVGSYQGELLTNLTDALPEYTFRTIALDNNREALTHNKADQIIVSQGEALPFDDQSIDVVIARYMLQWNDAENQKRILHEMARSMRKLGLIEHVGGDNDDPDIWRQHINRLFSDTHLPQLNRSGHFFSSAAEVEKWMDELGIHYKRIDYQYINNGTDVYVERYGLNDEESLIAKTVMGEKNYFYKTDWVLLPN